LRFFAKNEVALTATGTPPAMATMPTDADPLPDTPSLYAGSDGIDNAGYLVPRHPGKL
jgi:hypothetical protein